MEAEFTCSICLDIAECAVETSCCNHVFCESCISRVTEDKCPHCRSPFHVVISHLARRIIGNMKTECTHANCGRILTRSAFKEHEKLCQHRIFSCPSENCEFKGPRNEYREHLYNIHEDELVENASKLFVPKDDKYRTRNSILHGHHGDIIRLTRNTAGREARLGNNGKFYCGGDLGDVTCSCCDGVCGPVSGCNCKPCMMLDVHLRKLPERWLVNKSGAMCRESSTTGQFYCGRKVMNISVACDGWCGPENGPNCYACQCIQRLHATRYDGVW